MNTYAVSAARPAGFGALAFGLLLGAYFGLLTLISGWQFTVSQFSDFWYYIVPLGAGFGLQVALYMRLRQLLHQSKDARNVMAASGTTSTAAMPIAPATSVLRKVVCLMILSMSLTCRLYFSTRT